MVRSHRRPGRVLSPENCRDRDIPRQGYGFTDAQGRQDPILRSVGSCPGRFLRRLCRSVGSILQQEGFLGLRRAVRLGSLINKNEKEKER